MSYGDRIKFIRKQMRISQQELAQKLNVSPMIISRLESGETLLKAPILTKFDYMGVNISWLLTGKGEPLTSSIPSIDNQSYSVPIVDVSVSAGTGIMNEQEMIIGTAEISMDFKSFWGPNTVILKVSGDSMAPTIPKNAWVLVQKTTQLKSEGIFIFLQDNELRCKRIQKKGTGEIIVKSDNPLYENEIYPKNSIQLGELVLLGEVVGCINTL